MINTLSGQVKIGNNPQNLNPASVLELESTNRVLVITRVTDAQMNLINPLEGAIVYNTDQECLHYYNGTEWINICEELDNSFTVSTRADYLSLLNPQARDSTVVISQTNNPDGSINYNYEVGQITGANIVTQSINADSKIQPTSITTGLLAPKSVTIGKFADATGGQPGDIFQWNGSQWTLVNESVLGITEKDSIVGNEVVGPSDATLLLNGNGSEAVPFTLDVSEGGITAFEIATGAVTTEEILNGTILEEDIANDAITTTKILDANITNTKLDKANIPLSGFGAAGAPVDLGNQNMVNVADPANPLDAVNLQYLEGAIVASEAADLDTDPNNEIQDAAGVSFDDTASTLGQTTVQGAIDALAASNAADLDTDPNNEIQDAAGVSFDDTASTLGQTTVQGAIDALAASNAADLDTDPNNENQTVSEGDGITVTNPTAQEFNVAVTNPVVALGKINSDGSNDVGKLIGASISYNALSPGEYAVLFDTARPVGDNNYIVQLTLIGAGPDFSIEVTGTPSNAGFTVQISQLSIDAVPSLTSSPTDADWYFTVTNL
tara:strand:+ start:85323 stop:86981 length:1659 start_codon:yes stop_codon:yes gene_type:complete